MRLELLLLDLPWREEEELVCANLLSGVVELVEAGSPPPRVLALDGADLDCLVGLAWLSLSLVVSSGPTETFRVSDNLLRPAGLSPE